MKKLLLGLVLAAGAAGATAQNIDIQIGQTNYYGRIDLLNFGTPQLVYKEAIWVDRPANYRSVQPLYLRVPPGHAKKWSKHCDRYDACGRPVYFVQDSWYNNTYAPRYRKVKGGDYGRDERRERDDNFRLSERTIVSSGMHNDRDHGRDKHDDKRNKHDKHDKHEGKGHKDKGGHGKGNGKGKD